MLKTQNRLILLIIFSLMGSLVVAQSCTPDVSINKTGYYPSALNDGRVAVPYSSTIHAYSIRDTNSGALSATIDSIILNRITNLPPGLSYACNPPSCRFPSLKTGCINIYGTPAAASEGTYPLVIEVVVKTTVQILGAQNINQDVKSFSINIAEDNVGVNPTSKLGTISLYPNPTNNLFHILNPNFLNFKAQIISTTGQIVYDENVYGAMNTEINSSSFSNGLYTILISLPTGQSYNSLIQILH